MTDRYVPQVAVRQRGEEIAEAPGSADGAPPPAVAPPTGASPVDPREQRAERDGDHAAGNPPRKRTRPK